MSGKRCRSSSSSLLASWWACASDASGPSDTDAEHATVVAEKLRAAIAEITVAGVDRGLTASLGIATIPQHAGDGDQLVRTADRALYVAKTSGRNRVEITITSSGREPEPTSQHGEAGEPPGLRGPC
jgi:hypothetical protein